MSGHVLCICPTCGGSHRRRAKSGARRSSLEKAERNAKISAAREAGWSVVDIARQFGITATRVNQILDWKRQVAVAP